MPIAGVLCANLFYPLAQATAVSSYDWQRIGQALVMRASSSVPKLLADNNQDAQRLLSMLKSNKAIFPILSGKQTAPRWLYGLAREGQQPLTQLDALTVPLSPTATVALMGLDVQASRVSAAVFASLDALGRLGCRQRQPTQTYCPAAQQCPIAQFCRFGQIRKSLGYRRLFHIIASKNMEQILYL